MVINPWYSQNGDAIDLESCKNALIINSVFDAGDDAICINPVKTKMDAVVENLARTLS